MSYASAIFRGSGYGTNRDHKLAHKHSIEENVNLVEHLDCLLQVVSLKLQLPQGLVRKLVLIVQLQVFRKIISLNEGKVYFKKCR